MSNKAVYAIAISEGQANRVVDLLTESGCSPDDISVLFPDKETTSGFSEEKDTMMPDGVMTGVASGGMLGGTLGLLVGIGALVIPGAGPLIATGPLLSTFSGVAAGATVGGIAGGLIAFGIPEIEAKHYENRITKGDILISVIADTDEEVGRAKQVMHRAAAEDISVTSIDEAAAAFIG